MKDFHLGLHKEEEGLEKYCVKAISLCIATSQPEMLRNKCSQSFV